MPGNGAGLALCSTLPKQPKLVVTLQPVLLVLGRLKQNRLKFELSLGYSSEFEDNLDYIVRP